MAVSRRWCAIVAAVLVAAAVSNVSSATWDGGSTANSNWQTPENWDGNVAPVAGDDLVFSGNVRTSSNNDFPAGTTFNTLTMGLGGHVISGNPITLNAGLSSIGGIVNLDRIFLNASQPFSTSGGGGNILSPISLGAHTLTVEGTGTMQFHGAIDGTGGIVKNGAGRMDLFGGNANSYTGPTQVNDGLVQLGKTPESAAVSNSLIIGDGNGAAGTAKVKLLGGNQIPDQVTVNSDGELDLNGHAETVAKLTINDGDVTIGTGVLEAAGVIEMAGGSIGSAAGGMLLLHNDLVSKSTGSGTRIDGLVDLGGGTRAFEVHDRPATTDLDLTGGISNGQLMKTGAGRLRMSGSNTHPGVTTLAEGSLRVEGAQPQNAVLVTGGTLEGVGAVGPLNATGGTVAPEQSSFRGFYLDVNGDVQFSTSSVFRFTKAQSQGTSDGSLSVAGQVDLGGCTLELLDLSGTALLSPGSVSVLIFNDGTDPIVGTFAGLPEGACFEQFDRTFCVSYRGFDGNDVTLHVPATRTWDGGGADDNWSTAQNWVGDVAPREFDNLVFPQDAAQKTNSNDFFGTTFHSLLFSGSGYFLRGTPLHLTAGITTTHPASETGIADNRTELNILLEADQTFTAGTANTILRLGTLQLEGRTLTFAGAGSHSLGAALAGPGGVTVDGATVVEVFAFATQPVLFTVVSGDLVSRGDLSNCPVQVSGGSLSGFDNLSKIGPVTASGGVVRGSRSSFGRLAVAGDLALGANATFFVPSLLGNATGGNVVSARVTVSGAVRLGGSRLELGNAGNLAPGNTFIIIDNVGTDAVENTFAGLAEGATLTLGDSTASISYQGGDGNDVTLTVLSPTPTPTPTPGTTPTPTATPTATAEPTASPSPTASPGGGPTVLGNIATRLRVESGDNVLIGGFIVTGTEPKKVILRAIGPSLDFDGALANPQLQIVDGEGQPFGFNDNWADAANVQEIVDSTIPPTHQLESAFVASFAPGSYTAVVSGVDGGTGIGLVELYDLDPAAASKLANIATRGFVQSGDNVMIGGMIVLGDQSQRVIIRAIGPSLGISGQLEDPVLELYDGEGNLITSNNNWKDSQQSEIEATTIPPSNELESAIVTSLSPAAYTAVVRGADDATGIAVVEVYALNP